MGREHLYTTEGGVRKDWVDNGDGTFVVISSQDVDAALDWCKASFNLNAGYNKERNMKHVGFIPTIIHLKWLQEEGWDCYAPENKKRLWRKLNDIDWMYLRTSPGHL